MFWRNVIRRSRWRWTSWGTVPDRRGDTPGIGESAYQMLNIRTGSQTASKRRDPLRRTGSGSGGSGGAQRGSGAPEPRPSASPFAFRSLIHPASGGGESEDVRRDRACDSSWRRCGADHPLAIGVARAWSRAIPYKPLDGTVVGGFGEGLRYCRCAGGQGRAGGANHTGARCAFRLGRIPRARSLPLRTTLRE